MSRLLENLSGVAAGIAYLIALTVAVLVGCGVLALVIVALKALF